MEDKKILLLSANTYRNPYPVYPIGISYLKTSLAKAFPDRSIDVCDMNFETEDSLRSILEKENYTYVGIGLRNIDDNNLFEKNSFVCWYRRLTHLIRQHSRAILIGGGVGYSIFRKFFSGNWHSTTASVEKGNKPCQLSSTRSKRASPSKRSKDWSTGKKTEALP